MRMMDRAVSDLDLFFARITTLGFKKLGDLVNIEIDAHTQAIVDTVERILPQLLELRAQ